MKIIDVNTWNRKEHFDFFSKFEEPFFSITTPIDCTKALIKAKELNIPFFVYYLHKTIAAINAVENFRLRIEDEKVILYDEIDASATILREDKTFGFSFMKFHDDIHTFNKSALTEIERIQNTKGLFTKAIYPKNIIHFSAIPWINFTGLTHSRSYQIQDSCPKISFGKVYEEKNKKLMSLSIMAHHGLVDGYHMGLFVEKLQKLMNG